MKWGHITTFPRSWKKIGGKKFFQSLTIRSSDFCTLKMKDRLQLSITTDFQNLSMRK